MVLFYLTWVSIEVEISLEKLDAMFWLNLLNIIELFINLV